MGLGWGDAGAPSRSGGHECVRRLGERLQGLALLRPDLLAPPSGLARRRPTTHTLSVRES